jgi:ESS family glutamate:Na+ symporter
MDSNAISTIEIELFPTITLSFIVYFIGVFLTRHFTALRDYNIPEPVSGGLAAACITWAYFAITNTQISFDMAMRDELLVIFFATIGLNARLADLWEGGKLLIILLLLTVIFVIFQNGVALGVTEFFELPRSVSVLIGSASFIGGHGTSIAWGETIQEISGFAGSSEMGIAMATLGLVAAALVGGPIAKWLVERYKLQPEEMDSDGVVVGIPYHQEEDEEQQHYTHEEEAHHDVFDEEEDEVINHVNLMRSLLAAHVAVMIGILAQKQISDLGLHLPLFVPSMLAGVLMSNTIPYLMPKLPWPARSRSLALISDYSLSIFLVMSLMSMQLWTISGFGAVLFTSLILQIIFATFFIIFVLFRFMGSDYNAAVLSAGFAGFALGATPTAIANMSSVTKHYGPAPLAFIILPLVSAFFIDLVNAVVIQFFVSL